MSQSDGVLPDTPVRRRISSSMHTGRSLPNLVNLVMMVRGAFKPGAPQDKRTPEEKRADALEAAHQHLSIFMQKDGASVCADLSVDANRGLSSVEARERLVQHGPNELDKDPPTPMWKLFLDQFADLLVIMLIVASIVAAALGQIAASVVIIIIVIANAVLGMVQEARAGAALDALANMSSPLADVVRDGNQSKVSAEDLVPGDIVLLEAGSKVPADIRLLTTQKLQCSEVSFTGESQPITKNADFIEIPEGQPQPQQANGEAAGGEKKEKKLNDPNMVFMGCPVLDGRGSGVVVKTGMHTKMGEIANLIMSADENTSPLQAKLHRLGVKLGLASIFISIVVFVVGVTTERGADPNSDEPVWLQMLLVAVSLTVAAVPEGLPACVTITLAIGMRHMVQKHALIRNLHSVETLGSASVICTDKTGTLTKGEMTARRLWFQGATYRITGEGYEPKGAIVPMDADYRNAAVVEAEGAKLREGPHTDVLLAATLCSNARIQYNDEKKEFECVGNASERPLIVAAAKVGIDAAEVNGQYPRLKENPFQSSRKMMSVLTDTSSNPKPFAGASYAAIVKGAPNFILSNTTRVVDKQTGEVRAMTPQDRAEVEAAIDGFSSEALRVLAVGYQPFAEHPGADNPEDLERDLVLVGLMASIDPERSEVAPSIQKAYNAGIRVVMITGDYVKTAKAIAENIELLPRGSPEQKAIDCAIVREIGNEIKDLQDGIEEAKKSGNKGQKSMLEHDLAVVEAKIDKITAYTDVYARAKPEDKMTIVRSLQRQGHVCSMTGDGVNDAPALRQANIGVAMGITGTDVAKAAAAMVLTDDNFVSIVEAIEEGRTIYANITKFCYFLLSTNVSEVFLILIAVIMGLQSPLLPIQILWLNLTTDGAPAIALAIELTEPGIMEEGPRPQTENLLEKVMFTGIAIQTVTLTALTLGAYIIGLEWNVGSWNGKNDLLTPDELDHGTKKAQTMVIFLIVFAELARAYGARSLRQSVFRMGLFSNQWMQYAVGTALGGTLLIGLVPGVMDIFSLKYLDGREWALVLGFTFIPIAVDELTKVVYRATGFGERPKARRVDADSEGEAEVLREIERKVSQRAQAEAKDHAAVQIVVEDDQ